MVPLEGMVSMPSFHTTLAILFIYALRHMRYLLLFSIPLNVTMILSTPTQGGHYLADVFAGLLLSALTISTLRSSSRLISNHISEDASKGAVRDGIYALPSFNLNRQIAAESAPESLTLHSGHSRSSASLSSSPPQSSIRRPMP